MRSYPTGSCHVGITTHFYFLVSSLTVTHNLTSHTDCTHSHIFPFVSKNRFSVPFLLDVYLFSFLSFDEDSTTTTFNSASVFDYVNYLAMLFDDFSGRPTETEVQRLSEKRLEISSLCIRQYMLAGD